MDQVLTLVKDQLHVRQLVATHDASAPKHQPSPIIDGDVLSPLRRTLEEALAA